MKLDTLALIPIVFGIVVWGLVWLSVGLSLFPYGLIILFFFLIIAFILGSVLRQRMRNQEDNYYEKNVDQ
ncbi:MAG: hypothetical protein K0U74_03800 [Alphaproteobacteria bacterium]|nr:hypothetical protein [Alphaproteobacteria bacterium]